MRAPRPALAIALLAALLVTAIAGAMLSQGPPRVALTDNAEAADRLTLYQTGLALVEFTRNFEAGINGDTILTLRVPATTILDSLTVQGDGVALREIRSTLETGGFLRPGDPVIVHVDTTRHVGTVIALEGDTLLLATSEGTTVVQLSRASAVEIQDRRVEEAEAGTAEVTLLVDAQAGDRSVRVSYLARGPGWTPNYVLDAKTGDIQFFATLTGLADWKQVQLELISGAPNVVFAAPPPMPMMRFVAGTVSADEAGAPSGGFGPGVPLGELHRYTYGRPVDLTRGESVRIPVAQGRIDILRHAYEAQAHAGHGYALGTRIDVGMLERLEIRNTLDEPLPPGVVRFYRDGRWVGEDVLPATPPGDRANVTMSRAENVKARLVLERLESLAGRDVLTYGMTVQNFRPESADVRVKLDVQTYRTRVVDVTPTPTERTGASILWDDTLTAGGAKTYRVTLEVDTSRNG